jgi:predicted membrane protein
MALVDINFNPTKKDIRVFGIAIAVIGLAFVSIFHFIKHASPTVSLWILISALAASLLCLILPQAGKYIFITLSLITFPIGFAVNFIIMAIFFFVLLTPLALIQRIFGRDALGKKFNPDAETYFLKHAMPKNCDRYFRQF